MSVLIYCESFGWNQENHQYNTYAIVRTTNCVQWLGGQGTARRSSQRRDDNPFPPYNTLSLSCSHVCSYRLYSIGYKPAVSTLSRCDSRERQEYEARKPQHASTDPTAHQLHIYPNVHVTTQCCKL